MHLSKKKKNPKWISGYGVYRCLYLEIASGDMKEYADDTDQVCYYL